MSFSVEERRKPITTLSVWRRATPGDYAAFVRACLNTSGAAFYTAGSAAGLYNQIELCAAFFCAGNLSYIVTGIWWAFAANREFQRRYGAEEMWHNRGPPRAVVAGPGTVPPPYVNLPANLESFEIVHAFHSLTWLDIFSALCQVIGAAVFTVGCGTQWYPELLPHSIAFWAVGSGFFVLQGIIGHIMCTSFVGTWLTLIPRTRHYKQWLMDRKNTQFPICCQSREGGPATSYYKHLKNACWHKCVPAALLNTLGSLLFVVGSLILIWDLAVESNWCYLIGSLMFLLSNYSDAANVVDELYQRVTQEDKAH